MAKFETKYDKGDCVFFLFEGRIFHGEIEEISVNDFILKSVTYGIRYSPPYGNKNRISLEEKYCFQTKDELAKDLISKAR